MQTHNLGYPRIGSRRELKKACEKYWSGQISQQELFKQGYAIKADNWRLQQRAGIDWVPSNDFSYYDQVLDHCLMVGAIPDRYHAILVEKKKHELDLYFAMARGYQRDGLDVKAMEMTKWFDTNYHYIVPEFQKNQQFELFSEKVIHEFEEAKVQGILTKPVLLGPVSFLLLGKEKDSEFDRIDLLDNLLPVYLKVLEKLVGYGAEWVQFDEPFLALSLSGKEQAAMRKTYALIKKAFPHLKTMVATYFGGLDAHLGLAAELPVCALHVDLVRAPHQLGSLLDLLRPKMSLSLGLVDGRNVWRNDFQASLDLIRRAVDKLGSDRVWVAPSCSLLHVPCDLELENGLDTEIKGWLAFAKQKIEEVVLLQRIGSHIALDQVDLERIPWLGQTLEQNRRYLTNRSNSTRIHNEAVKASLASVLPSHSQRSSPYAERHKLQAEALALPIFPTTTIGSFPQTKEVRQWRARYKKGELSLADYENLLKAETERCVRWQDELGLDVLVHGEFERNDMVEYFGEQLEGFAFTTNGWVQSYGSRCVKPPIIYGDVSRKHPMTVDWTVFAQSLTRRPMKGMLTGPITILQWSFVRNDQPRKDTCFQIALAIREEVSDLEQAGIRVIQIDEPALREGLPLKASEWPDYLDWAVTAFRLSASVVGDHTQIHTHMCYSEFNDIISHIAAMDADVITIECSRSQMELLDAFAAYEYPNEIGPGVYDIHAPRIPSSEEMIELMEKAIRVVPKERLWVNPDCGLKTRGWEETQRALEEMVKAADGLRAKFALKAEM
ncbi:MAG: 5-methyltetrahydropteroyltriglutamate--homocysteine S-methyltransferase [Lunatimonas sp.]|uniref:5-methyltetrahydropteroyltriglutamate-- homocysteine S-methyltransferase n=1 Tax=Lunatimonas sp. TaxID=2060141 RepID=UPI00263A4970|nr:5-methyltetrahydropteroyltriglutamate--homocysteine S-methyltransferase [Lunatimonas sp.]MCC5938300.1 5-methyltetrahydropteroyltriglutamate--homocysteine S-methyltransferase [Lunatimonas sp.]